MRRFLRKRCPPPPQCPPPQCPPPQCPPPSKTDDTVFSLDNPSEHGECGEGLAHMCVEQRSGADDPEVCWCGRPATVFTLDEPSKDGVCDEGLVDMCVDQSSVPNEALNSHHPGGDENVDVRRHPQTHSDLVEEQQKMCELVCGGRDPSLPPPNQPPSPDDVQSEAAANPASISSSSPSPLDCCMSFFEPDGESDLAAVAKAMCSFWGRNRMKYLGNDPDVEECLHSAVPDEWGSADLRLRFVSR